MHHKNINILLILLLLWNPLMILLLTRNIYISVLLPFCILVLGYWLLKSPSFRLKVWAFNLCALTSICSHSELLFREFYNNLDIPNLYELHGKYYFNKPYITKKFSTNEYVSNYYTNSQGYRIDELDNANEPIRHCDWLFIGDSFTQGAQVDYQDLYTSKLYRNYPDKVIVNAGISGAGLYDELNYFRDRGKQLNPKVVFLQIGVFNDFFNIKEHKATFQDYLMEKSNLYRFIAFNVFSTDSLPLGRWTEPFFPTKQENIDYNILYQKSSPVKDLDVRTFKQCITEWKREVESIGGELKLILIPTKEQTSPELLYEVMQKYHIKQTEIDMDAPNRLLKQEAKQLKLQTFDLTNDFRHSKDFPFFHQDEHMNVIGHDLVAHNLTIGLKKDAHNIKSFSNSNSHDRYPSFYSNDSILLFQTQDHDHYKICKRYLNQQLTECIITSVEELIHPIYSNDLRYIAYTEGNQNNSETDVILYDNVSEEYTKINERNCYAAIPMISPNCTLIAFPSWKNKKNSYPKIYVYDIKKKRVLLSIPAQSECWRPIFNKNSNKIFYIQKEKKFIVKLYDLKTNKSIDVFHMPYDIWDITLSPSEKYLVYAGNKDGNWDLFSYCFKTKQIKQLTKTIGNEWDPSFGLNDNELWYAGTFGFNDGIYQKTIKL